MQNPFTTTFSKTPEYTYIATEQTDEILENFEYQHPSESVYKITGVRGSGKTVILTKIEEALRSEENSKNGWLVFDISPSRDMLNQVVTMLQKAGFSKEKKTKKSFNVSASVMGTGAGIGYSAEKNEHYDVGVEIDEMMEEAAKQNKKILIGIDEISKTNEMIIFAAEFGRWLRASYPVYLVCTGLYENIMDVSNVKNLTFFRRATTIKTEPLNMVRMTEMYKKQLNVEHSKALEMARMTKGYAYAFQELGVLYFKNAKRQTMDEIEQGLKTELFAYSYEKIWEELTEGDRRLLALLSSKEEYKREEILQLLGEKAKNYSVYRDRLMKRGLLNTRQGYIALSLPYFGEYIQEYCMDIN